MADHQTPAHLKAEMPQIPGVSGPRKSTPNPMLPLIIGLVVIGIILLFAVRWLSRSKPIEPARAEQAPQLEIPPAPPDPASLLPHATESDPAIATVTDLSKPWASADFFVRNRLTGENIPATIVRLPSGSATLPTGYWAFSRKPPYGSCLLEYVADLNRLREEYGFPRARHPLVGNPCSRTLYDPLKTSNLPGDIWMRGAIVQGSDIRPPLGVEIKIQGKQILAMRSE
jgi:hypothetical protein